jgi:8-oxo-dGTP pyrophosphatase MutT (NUDIX family)
MKQHRWRSTFEPIVRRLFHLYWWAARGMTLGVRAVVVDGTGRVFLVEHSYVAGWHFPGGGVEVGETLGDALARELVEEGNIVLAGTPSLHGVYFHDGDSRRDHIAVFVVRDFHQAAAPQPNREIVAHGFFPLDRLPDGTTAATRRRIAEVFDGAPLAERW